MLEVKYNGTKPTKQRKKDAAFDIRALSSGVVPPGSHALVATGTQVAVPEGMAALVMPRSGLASRYGVTVLNSPGLVDPDYTGDIGVILYNSGKESFYFDEGDRIAQLMFIEVADVKLSKSVKPLKAETRGAAGFGSSGAA